MLMGMIKGAKYVHTNLVARDWKRLAQFYQTVFGCEPVPPERDFKGERMGAVTGLSGAQIQGAHLRMPGFGNSGPTLEIFQYHQMEEKDASAINQPGFAHIAFEVDSVEDARDEFNAHGGSPLGELVTLTIEDGKQVTLIYMRDPEGNIVELQRWSEPT